MPRASRTSCAYNDNFSTGLIEGVWLTDVLLPPLFVQPACKQKDVGGGRPGPLVKACAKTDSSQLGQNVAVVQPFPFGALLQATDRYPLTGR